MKKLAKSAAIPFAVMTAMSNVPAAVMGDVLNEGGAQNAEQMLVALTQKVDDLSGPIKATAEQALAEVQKQGSVSAETKATADKALTDITATAKAVETLKALVEGQSTQLLEVSQKVAAGLGRGSDQAAQTLGQAVVAQEDKIKGFVENGLSGAVTFSVENAITTAGGSGGGLIAQPEETEPVRMARRQLRIWQLLTMGNTQQNLVHYRRQVLRNLNADTVAEQGTIPTSEIGFEKAQAAVKKIAHVTNISEEAMTDADQLQTEIDSELRYGLELERERQILSGDGVGENLSGLLTEATAFVAAAGAPNTTHIDRIRLAMLQIQLQDYTATSLTLNPTDWTMIDLLKDSRGKYLHSNPAAMTAAILWGLDVVSSNSMAVGEWLVGDLAMAATAYRRKDVEVLISSEHGTNFIEDMLTMKATERLAMAIKRPLAMVTGNFTFV